MTWPDQANRLSTIAYEGMAPVVKDDAQRGYPLLKFLHAYYMPLQTVDDIVRDRPEEGLPGWGILLDPDLCPVRYLPFLAMLAGARINSSMSETEVRSRIKLRDGQKRCRPEAIAAAVQALLTGTKTVYIRQRYNAADPTDDDPGYFDVVTLAGETPDPDAVLRAIQGQKTIGLIFTYHVLITQDWYSVRATYATWQDVKDAYPTWQDVRDDVPSA